MNRYALAASTLSAALGLAVAMTATVSAAEMPGNKMVQENMMRAQKYHLEKCYGINAVSKNDCAEGAHSCAGQATAARDPKSFVLLPHGDCSKIAGGSLSAG